MHHETKRFFLEEVAPKKAEKHVKYYNHMINSLGRKKAIQKEIFESVTKSVILSLAFLIFAIAPVIYQDSLGAYLISGSILGLTLLGIFYSFVMIANDWKKDYTIIFLAKIARDACFISDFKSTKTLIRVINITTHLSICAIFAIWRSDSLLFFGWSMCFLLSLMLDFAHSKFWRFIDIEYTEQRIFRDNTEDSKRKAMEQATSNETPEDPQS